jgi:probable F420-dependent oxidoreductase
VNVGVTVPFPGVPLRELGPLAARAEDLGFESLWSAESTDLDGITPLAVAAAHTSRVRLVTGIVSAYTRAPGILAQTAAALADLSGGRFVLGLGASSNVIVEQWNGIPFERPLAKVRETVEWLRPVLAGERSPSGFKLATPPAEPVPIVLAALRERMLRLAAKVADGAFTNLLPLTNAGHVVDAFGAPEKELACRFFSVLGPEEEALPLARRIFCAYATVPVYTEFFRWLGRGEEIEPLLAAWAAGDRKRATEVVPEGLLRDVFLLGPVEAQRERLAEFAEAGITTAVVLPFGPPGELEQALAGFAPR